MVCPLPAELLQSTLDNIPLCDITTISNFSLASLQFHAIAQPYLFRTCRFALYTTTLKRPQLTGSKVTLESPISRASTFLDMARQSPRLLGYIRRIEVKVKERTLEMAANDFSRAATHDNHSGLALTEILLKAPNIQELLFASNGSSLSWSSLPEDLVDAISCIAPRLVSLGLGGVGNGSFSVEQFLQFPQLKRLIVDNAVRRNKDWRGNTDLKRISLQYVEIGQGYVEDKQLRWLYEDLDLTQLQELLIRGTRLSNINPLICSRHLTRLELIQEHSATDFEDVVFYNDNASQDSSPQTDQPRIQLANFQHLISLQELIIHGRVSVSQTHTLSDFAYVAAGLRTFPDDNQLSRVTLELSFDVNLHRLTREPFTNIDFDSMFSVLFTPLFTKLEMVALVFTTKVFSLSHRSRPALVGSVIDDAFVDEILCGNPVLWGMMENGRVKMVVLEEE